MEKDGNTLNSDYFSNGFLICKKGSNVICSVKGDIVKGNIKLDNTFNYATPFEIKVYTALSEFNIKNIISVKPKRSVLVRNSNEEPWKLDLLLEINNNKYKCFTGEYNFCIYYVGNEHLEDKVK